MDHSLPFARIIPLRLVGASSRAPFCSIIAENKLIYSAGNNIILQNTKNNQQKILHTHTRTGTIQLIAHHVTLYNEHLLAIALRDSQSLMNVIVIVSLNSAIFNLQSKKQVEQTFFLRHIEQYEEIQSIHFFEDGTLLGFVSNYGSISSFSLMRTSNADVLLHQGYPHTKIFMGSASISKQSYVAVILQDLKDGVRLCLMATDQLSRRLYYSLQLNQNIQIISCSFESIQQDSFYLLALIQSGDILIYKVNDFTATLVSTIPVNMKNQQGCVIQRAMGMQCAGNKLVVFYEQSKTISLVQFSSLNPNNHKMVVLRETLNEYTNIAAVHSLRISKDNCTVAGLFRLSSKTYPALPQNMPTSKTLTVYGSLESTINIDCSQFINRKQDEYIALQMDILQNLIDFKDKQCSVEQTLSLYAGHDIVKKAEYCAHTNSLFLLLQNKTIKYYDLIPENTTKAKTQKKGTRLELWSNELAQQPTTIAAHPFNFSIALIYNDIVKFHHYNCKSMLPAHIVASIKPTSFAVYSLLGDKLILAHHSSLTIIDSYTYQIIRNIALNSQPIASLTSLTNKQVSSKMISAIYMSSFDEMMILCGHNSLSVVSGWQKSVAFGNFEGYNQKIKQIVYDSNNKLTLVVLQDIILILSKPSLSTNKCSLVSKLELSASCILLRAELGILFIGANDGSVIMVKWPHYQQQDLYCLHGQNRIFLFDQPITSIHVTSNMRYLYAISQRGAIAICQLQVADGEQIDPQSKHNLLRMSDIPLKLFNCWLVSRTDQERKQREIIKLRGQQADRNSQHSLFAKEQASGCNDIIVLKKKQLDEKYAEQIRQYEEQLGLKKVLQQVSLLKDEIRVVKRRTQRDISNIKFQTEQVLNKHFQQTAELQQQYQHARIEAINQKQALKTTFKNQLTALKDHLQTQNATILQKIASTQQHEAQAFQRIQLELGSAHEDNTQTTQLMRISFQEEKEQLLEAAQVVISKNRNTNIAIHNLHNKMSELGIEKEKIEYDMFKVELQKQQIKTTLSQLSQILQGNNVIYNQLIQKTRKLQAQLHQQRKKANTNEQNLNKLLLQIDQLDQHQKYLDHLYQSASSQFVSIKQQHRHTTLMVQSFKNRLVKLRNMKSSKNYEEGLAKNRLVQSFKTLGRELQLSDNNAIEKVRASIEEKQGQIQQNKLGRQYESLQAQKQKLSVDANKWMQIKESYKTSFRRIYHRLNDQNIKLTYQYNDLLKVSQQYKIYLNHLTNAIADHSKKKQRSKMPKLMAKENKQQSQPISSKATHSKLLLLKKGIIKKAVCISLHEQSGKFITQSQY